MDADDLLLVFAVGLIGVGIGVVLFSIGWGLIAAGGGWLALIAVVRCLRRLKLKKSK